MNQSDITGQLPVQTSLPGLCPIQAAIEKLAATASVDELGAVFTRHEVVDFILDLSGYTADKPLFRMHLLEPSFGNGDFLMATVSRLLKSWREHGCSLASLPQLKDAIRAVELHRDTFQNTRVKLDQCLVEHGFDSSTRAALLDAWLVQGDFLLAPFPFAFTHVVGNPPYVRQELIPDVLIAEYRKRFNTIYDRADLYVPFIEKSLQLLAPGGSLGFICADRWMKNRYGGPLRRFVADNFHLRYVIDMVGTPAFHSDVIAYPAIMIIEKGAPKPTRIAYRPNVVREELSKLARELSAPLSGSTNSIMEVSIVGKGSEPWLLGASDQLAVVRRLETDYPLIEKAGCRVGIGVATGADRIFIAPDDCLDVEDDRKLPLAMTRDIADGTVKWQGFSVINPFDNDGGLVSLDRYPKLARYLEAHREALGKRHVAQKAPRAWFRTIDRIMPGLASRPKLLIPDIKGDAQIVHEEGKLYPHHNLYYIVSDEWDLKALQSVLRSGIARLFVATYSTKMRGDYLRFQAQYLRRIRIPRWDQVPDHVKRQLIDASVGSPAERDAAVSELYDLTEEEQAVVFQNNV